MQTSTVELGAPGRLPKNMEGTNTCLKRTWGPQLSLFRLLVGLTAGLAIWEHKRLDSVLAWAWTWLSAQYWFRSVYFETFYVVVYYTILSWCYVRISRSPCLYRFRIFHKHAGVQSGVWATKGAIATLKEAVAYITPLALLDTFMRKRYSGVPAEVWEELPRGVQHVRLLPVDPPTALQVVSHTLLALLIYDVCFGLLHCCLHEVRWLYERVHAIHHSHGPSINAADTNRLSIVERITIILLANASLLAIGAHPLTRVVFVIPFVGLLVDSHSGYDFPLWYDKVLPCGVVKGAMSHYNHHMHGGQDYSPFFWHTDWLIRRIKSCGSLT